MSVHDETPAETIRRAIEQMRATPWRRDRATADLLEAVFADVDDGSTVDDLYEDERAALRLARTYLGETP